MQRHFDTLGSERFVDAVAAGVTGRRRSYSQPEPGHRRWVAAADLRAAPSPTYGGEVGEGAGVMLTPPVPSHTLRRALG